MGKKSERLQEDLDIAEAENHAQRRRIVELEDALAEARKPGPASPSDHGDRLVMTSASSREIADGAHRLVAAGKSSTDRDNSEPVDTESVDSPEYAIDRAAAADLQAIQELHRPALTSSTKPESALDIVRANNQQRADLVQAHKLLSTLVGRIASALKIDRWDEDGTEILDKVMLWSTFVHWLRQRQKLATGAVANELGTVLSALVAPADLAAWIMTHTAEQMPECAVEVASERPVQTKARVITKSELQAMFTTWVTGNGALNSPIRYPDGDAWWLGAALQSSRATSELLALLNMVLVPFLRRQQSVTGPLP